MRPVEHDTVRHPRFPHPLAFWLGVLACVVGVGLHLPMYFAARDMGYRLADMRMDPAMAMSMAVGMALILLGLAAALYGLLPRAAGRIRQRVAGIRVRALDDAPIRFSHVALLVVMAFAVTIDVMKPTTLSFVAPGVAAEYGLKTAANPHGSGSVTWLPLFGILGTVVGSLLWGWLADRIGRRSSILFAGILFVSTAICGAMPGFDWNLLMCFVMGIGAGGMVPIAFTLIAEITPVRHRGWLIVLIGGDIAGAYVLTSWLAGALTPEFSWRILWLIGMPTGLVLILLNRWVPESPRYLLATGQRAAADAVLRRYGSAVTTEPVLASESGVRDGFAQFLRRPYSGRTVAVIGLAVSVGLLTYGFQFWVPTDLQRLGLTEVSSDFVLRDSALMGLPLTLIAALLYGFWNGRRTVVLLCVLTAVSVLAVTVFAPSLAHDPTLLAVLLVIPLSGISSLTALVVAYGTEIYPTRVRARGSGLIAGATKAGGVLVLAIVLAAAPTPSLVATAIIGALPLLLATAVFLRTGPETRQRALEDITEADLVAS